MGAEVVAGCSVVTGGGAGVPGSAPATAGSTPSIGISAAGTASALRIRFLRLVFRIASSSVVPPTAMSADMRKIGVRSEIR
ncbi:hypothetical protein TPB0596_25320 [Tsukamurella pulmonis]|nr:hypothetical protein TPB0596_25320 [Tsukamurella pulmonis]